MRWLIVLDGTERTEKAAAFTRPLVSPDEDEVIFLTVAEDGAAAVPGLLGHVQEVFSDISTRVIHQNDPITETVEKLSEAESVDLVVYGSRGRKGLSRLLLGSVAAYLEQHLDCSLLIVRGEVRPLKKILVATSLNPEFMHAVELGGWVAARTGAAVTVLHVMSQMPLLEGAVKIPLKANAEEAIEEGTLEGEFFINQLRYLEASGLDARAVLRHGLVLDELTAEMKEGGYDLLVIGAHRVPKNLPFGSWLTKDVAGEILMQTQTSVLIA